MATYSITTTPRQDTVLAYVAGKRGTTVQAFVDGEMARILKRAVNEFEQDDAAQVSAAYLAATALKQNQVKTVLGL